jgi:hypothetical protein
MKHLIRAGLICLAFIGIFNNGYGSPRVDSLIFRHVKNDKQLVVHSGDYLRIKQKNGFVVKGVFMEAQGDSIAVFTKQSYYILSLKDVYALHLYGQKQVLRTLGQNMTIMGSSAIASSATAVGNDLIQRLIYNRKSEMFYPLAVTYAASGVVLFLVGRTLSGKQLRLHKKWQLQTQA